MTVPDDWEAVATFDFLLERRAQEIVRSAFEEASKGAPGFPKVHEKRLDRARRLSCLGEDTMLTAIVAQWLSAKKHASAAAAGRAAVERVAVLADEVDRLQRQLAELAEGLAFEATTTAGETVWGNAHVAARSLKEAMPSLRFAQEVALEMQELLPTDARGRSGVVAGLRKSPPDETLAIALADLWRARGLSISGGESGDGLDIFLATILGKTSGAKALKTARKKLLETTSRP